MSAKPRKVDYRVSKPRQVNVRKRGQGTPAKLDVERLKNNLGQLVSRLCIDGKVAAYQQIANEISELAGRDEPWTWRYVRSVEVGTIEPGKKFISALGLLLEDLDPHSKQWFYFLRRRSLAAVLEKSIMREQITEHMSALGFRAVPFKVYNEARKRIRMRK